LSCVSDDCSGRHGHGTSEIASLDAGSKIAGHSSGAVAGREDVCAHIGASAENTGAFEATKVVIQVKTLSGSSVLGSHYLSTKAKVKTVLELLTPPEGCRAILLLGHVALYDEEAELATLALGGGRTHGPPARFSGALELVVVWEPALQKGEQVAVAHDFMSRTNYRSTMLLSGQVGTILKIHDAPGACRATSGHERETGDALVNFAGSNHWVSKQDLRKLRRL